MRWQDELAEGNNEMGCGRELVRERERERERKENINSGKRF